MTTCQTCGGTLRPDASCPACLLAPDDGMATATLPSTREPPPIEELRRRLPDFEIIALQGRGGMGAVYRARQRGLAREVALKIVVPDRPEAAARFAVEARALSLLSHPGIVAVHAVGSDGDLCWLAMEFVDGPTLRAAMRSGALSPERALALIPTLCDALQYAHDRGVVHRDIKPENLLLDRGGQLKIADFGLARLLSGGRPSPAATRDVMGTPSYMAPEQIERPTSVDHRADLYALGVVVYELLTGALPLGRFPPPSRTLAVDVRFDEVVLRALEKEPERRWQRAGEFGQRVGGIVASPRPVRAASWSEDFRTRRTWRGWPLLHVASGVDPLTGRPRVARGVVAIGPVAVGALAIGGRARGVVACGGVATGVVALGGAAFGVVAFGGVAVGPLAACGGLALGLLACGGVAAGGVAFGGVAAGWVGIGGAAVAVHALSAVARDPLAQQVAGDLGFINRLAAFAWLPAVVIVAALGIGKPLLHRVLERHGIPGDGAHGRGLAFLPFATAILLLLVVGGLMLAPRPVLRPLPAAAGPTPSADLLTTAASLATAWSQRRWEDVRAPFDEGMRRACSAAVLESTWDEAVRTDGAFIAWEQPIAIADAAGFRQVRVPARFADRRAALTAVFTADGAVTGLWLRPQPPDDKAAVARARQVAAWLVAEDFARVEEAESPEARAILDAGRLADAWHSLARGRPVVPGEPGAARPVDGFAVVAVPLTVAEERWELTVTSDDRGQVVGVLLSPGQ